MDTTTTFKFETMPFHHVMMKDRKSVELTGIKTIESFDSTEFLIDTTLGFLNIKGEGLNLASYNQEKGEVTIKGTIDVIQYVENRKAVFTSKEKFLGKLLK